jgi:eukaryotic-like serine/threonine-protein kinase
VSEDRIGEKISHYRVKALIGEGGMGVVYRAEDIRLNRDVALKFLLPYHFAGEEESDRFLNEARSAARLAHPNICVVHEIDQTEGQPFISMAYLEGETLQKVLEQGPLPLTVALDYIIQIVSGLEAAHAKQIVHRDVKPANIMITPNGRAVIMDFGLAKNTQASNVTRKGMTIGTAAYMSPEQIQGVDVDSRADQWAIAAVFIEMLTGHRAFTGDHEPAILYAICHEAPAFPADTRRSLPPELNRIIQTCLQKDPAERFAETSQLHSALEALRVAELSANSIDRGRWRLPAGKPLRSWRWLSAALLFALALLALFETPFQFRDLFGDSSIPKRKYLAIIPFSIISDLEEDQALAAGLHEYLSSKLSHLEGLSESFWVVPAADIQKSEITSSREARQVFEVTLAVTGSLQRNDDRLCLTMNLVDANAHRQLNSVVIDKDLVSASMLQSDLLDSLTQMLHVELHPEVQALLQRGATAIAQTQELYLKGRGSLQHLDYLKRGDKLTAIVTAISYFEQSLRRDPNYALAHVGMGEALWQRYYWSRDARYIEPAISHCEQALVSVNEMPEALIALGVIFRETERNAQAQGMFHRALVSDATNLRGCYELARSYEADHEYASAESLYLSVITQRPTDWISHQQLGMFLSRQFRLEEAEHEFSRVLELAPENYFRGFSDLAGIYLYQQRLLEARQLLEQSLAIKPSYNAYSNLGTLLFYQKDYLAAIAAYEKALELHDHDYRIWGNLASAYWRVEGKNDMGRAAYQCAAELAEEQRIVTPENTTLLSSLAGYYGMLEQNESVLPLLQSLASIDPDNAETIFQIGHTFEYLGQREEALAWLQRSVAKGYPVTKIENANALTDLRADQRWIDFTVRLSERDGHEK